MKRVYTSGTFDLFHIGHLNILRRSKNLGDFLVVGVSTDELVSSYKSAAPIVPYRDRVDIIENLKCVDQVVKQETLFDIDLMKKLEVDIMTIGSDWQDKHNENLQKIIDDPKIEVVFFPYTQHVSTTKIKERIKDTGWQEDKK